MIKKYLLCVLVLVALLAMPVSAQTVDDVYKEQLQASGGTELLEQLPSETRELLETLGIATFDAEAIATGDAHEVLKAVWQLLKSVAKEPLRICGAVLCVVLIHAWVGGIGSLGTEEKTATLFSTVAVLAACAAIVTPIASCISRVAQATESLAIFMMSFVPVYAGILLAAGHTLSALSFQSIVLYAAQLLSLFSNDLVVPLMSVSLALGVIGAITPQARVGRLGESIGKTASWLLTLGTMLFSGLLSLQNLTGSAADTLGNRALRFSISSFVPLVGGSLSEAFATIKSSLGVLRSTTGVFGIAASVGIVLPPLLSCLVWALGLAVCRTCCDMFTLQPLSQLLQSAQTVVKCLIGVLCAGALFAVIAVTVVSTSAGGG